MPTLQDLIRPEPRYPFVKVADLSEIGPGKSKLVIGPADKPMVLCNVDGTFFAINAICPHRGGPLAQGILTGCIVACPWHGWTFDVQTGQPEYPGGHAVAAYEVKIEQGAVHVGWLKA